MCQSTSAIERYFIIDKLAASPKIIGFAISFISLYRNSFRVNSFSLNKILKSLSFWNVICFHLNRPLFRVGFLLVLLRISKSATKYSVVYALMVFSNTSAG